MLNAGKALGIFLVWGAKERLIPCLSLAYPLLIPCLSLAYPLLIPCLSLAYPLLIPCLSLAVFPDSSSALPRVNFELTLTYLRPKID